MVYKAKARTLEILSIKNLINYYIRSYHIIAVSYNFPLL